jgi:VWFA-related protein
MIPNPFKAAWLFFPIFLMICAPARPQNDPQKVLSHEVSVTLKLLQVYVTDKQGKAVNDLKKDEFEIWDDGKPCHITEFEAHNLSLGASPSTPDAPSPPRPREFRRKYFLFFDFAFNDAAGILTAKKAALDFIDTKLQLGDEVGVVCYDVYRGLVLNEYLTSDYSRVRRVVQEIKAKHYLGRAADVESDYLKSLTEIAEALGEGLKDAVNHLRQEEDRTYELQAGNFVQALGEFSKAVRYIQGQKTIVLFSTGLANYVIYGAKDWRSPLPRFGNANVRSSFINTYKNLAASNCSIYGINTSGNSSKRLVEPDLAGDLSLRQLARETGGKYFDNIKSYEKINEEIQNITGRYYVLGYYINEKTDGEFHKTKVKVRTKGCEVHGQTGYFNPKPFTEYSENEKVLHLIDLALSEKPHFQDAVDFPISVLPYETGAKTDLAVLAAIPVDRLTEVRGGLIELVTIVFNDQNDIVLLQRKELSRWPVSPVEAFAKSLISLPPGGYECRVVLRNLTTGKGARGSSRILIPEKPEAGASPPIYSLLLKSSKNPIYLGEETTQKEPPLGGIYPFDTQEYAPIIGKLRNPGEKILAVLPIALGRGRGEEPAFSAILINPVSGDTAELITKLLSRKKTLSGKEAFLLEIVMGAIKPGEYDLAILVDGLEPGIRLMSHAIVSIE